MFSRASPPCPSITQIPATGPAPSSPTLTGYKQTLCELTLLIRLSKPPHLSYLVARCNMFRYNPIFGYSVYLVARCLVFRIVQYAALCECKLSQTCNLMKDTLHTPCL